MVLALIASIVIAVTPKHGGQFDTYVISFKAPYATSKAAGTNYVVGAVNSTAGDCRRGVSSFGRVQSGPYRKGQVVRFRMHFRSGFCRGVFHGVVHYDEKVGDRIVQKRLGRFAFRVL
jgi:hypothetical protein